MLLRKPLFFGSFLFLLLISCGDKSTRKNAAIKVIELHKKAMDTYLTNLDSNYIYLKQAQDIAKATSISDSLKAENDYFMGWHFHHANKRDSAVVYLHRATEYVKDSIKTEREIQYFYRTWEAYQYLGRYGDCFALTRRYMSMIDKEKNHEARAWGYFFNQVNYQLVKDYDKSMEYSQRYLEAIMQIQDTLWLTVAQMGHSQLIYSGSGDLDGAIKIMDELIPKEKYLTNDINSQIFNQYGIFMYYKEDYQVALQYYLKAIEFTKKTTDISVKKTTLGNIYANVGEVYIDLGEYEKSEIYLDSVYFLGFNNLQDEVQRNTLNYKLRLAYNTKNDYREVSRFVDTIFANRDKAYKEKFSKDLIDLQKANEKEKTFLKEKQKSENKQTLLIFISTIMALLVVIVGLLYRQRSYEYEKGKLKTEQRLLRSQMNPHFTFNTLTAIQNLIEMNSKMASEYLVKFSNHLRLVFENSTEDFVLIDKELDALGQYLELQMLRYSTRFEYRIEQEGFPETTRVYIPPMLLQPLVENCVEHGFKGIKYAGRISIKLSLVENSVFCEIEDNGRGISAGKALYKRSTSTELISSFLNKTTSSSLSVINKADANPNETGVTVKFIIPSKKQEYDQSGIDRG